MACKKDCFHCPFDDCINDDYGPEDLAAVLAFEEACGVVFSSEKDALYQEIIEACECENKREKERRAMAARQAKQRKKQASKGFFKLPYKRKITKKGEYLSCLIGLKTSFPKK